MLNAKKYQIQQQMGDVNLVWIFVYMQLDMMSVTHIGIIINHKKDDNLDTHYKCYNI